MEIEQIKVGFMDVFCYLVSCPRTDEAIVIDHTSVDLFEQIPDEYLAIARNTPMVFSDRSVGGNIDMYLNCFDHATSWSATPSFCRRDYYGFSGSNWLWKTFSLADYMNNDVPERILFDPDPAKYDRSNWTYVYAAGEWEDLIAGFVTQIVPANVNSKDVLSFQLSYLNIDHGSNIDDANDGFFTDRPHNGYYENRERWDISDLEDLEAQYPSKTFIYWTTSLSRGLGSVDGENFNNQMRLYAIENDKILFDVADIEAHDSLGNLCYDNRDSVEYCNTNSCENHPSDGQSIVAICQDYTTEVDGGHLGSVSGGGIQIAKAFWVLMARLAGWDPAATTNSSDLTDNPAPTITPSPNPTPEPTPEPTSAPISGFVTPLDLSPFDEAIVIDVDLGVYGQGFSLFGDDQGVDFCKGTVKAHEDFVQATHNSRELLNCFGGRQGVQTVCQASWQIGHPTHRGIHKLFEHQFRSPGCHFLDLHAARLAEDHDRSGFGPINHHGQVKLSLYFNTFLNEELVDRPPLRPGLGGDQGPLENAFGCLPEFIQGVNDFDAASFPPASCVNLSFDHPRGTVQGLHRFQGVFRRCHDFSPRHGDFKLPEQVLSLIFVQFHSLISTLTSFTQRNLMAFSRLIVKFLGIF